MKIGDKIKVLLPAEWLGVKSDEPNLWVNAVIKDIINKNGVTAYNYRVCYNHKYKVPVIRINRKLRSSGLMTCLTIE